MGLNKMLKAGIEEEKQLLARSQTGSKAEKDKADPKTASTQIKANNPPPQKKKATKSKNRGGRPKKAEGQRRKQYTLTLRPETYQEIREKADAEGMSFAQYVERATREYINSHQ